MPNILLAECVVVRGIIAVLDVVARTPGGFVVHLHARCRLPRDCVRLTLPEPLLAGSLAWVSDAAVEWSGDTNEGDMRAAAFTGAGKHACAA